jgi:DNA-binding SARP family transcriptional activator
VTRNLWYENAYPLDTTYVILHPNFPNQHVLLSRFLARATHTPLLVSAKVADTNWQQFWDTLTRAFAEQTDQRLPNLPKSPQAAGPVLGKALAALGRYMFIIDSFDLLDQEAASDLIAAIPVPQGSQIVLSGRRLPVKLLAKLPSATDVQLFPVDPDRMLLNYADYAPDQKKLLEVYGSGPGHVLVNGRMIENWDGVLPRALFFYFIDRGMTTRDEIFSAFWPALPVREATNVFHVTKRKISEILGFDLTVYWSGFYRIAPDIDLHYDVVRFAEHVQNADVAEDNTAIALLERAIYLYHGAFLTSIASPWVASRREDLGMTYVDALGSLARLRERSGRHQEALGLYLQAGAMQPYREDFVRNAMTLYQKLGHPSRALEIYDRLVAELDARLKVSPDRRTNELADQIRTSREEIPGGQSATPPRKRPASMFS